MVSFVIWSFLASVAAVGCYRSARVLIKVINAMFDKVEEKVK